MAALNSCMSRVLVLLPQDRIIACTNVGSSGNRAFFGVFDGTAGDTASSFVQTQLLSDVAHYSDEQASKHQDTAEAPKEEEFAEVMTDVRFVLIDMRA